MSDDFDTTEWITTTEAAELTGYATAYFRQLINNHPSVILSGTQ